MTINYAILGLLSKKPMTGYDLKKVIQNSLFMYWSGNNNQIYKALLELSDQGYVEWEIKHQKDSPTKKVYRITGDGLNELKKRAKADPQLPEIKNAFLIQLAFADQLSQSEALELLENYKAKVEMQIKATKIANEKSEEKSLIIKLINENIEQVYIDELTWIQRAKDVITEEYDNNKINTEPPSEEETKLNYQVKEKNGIKYLLFNSEGKEINSEQDAIQIISLCAENDANRVLFAGNSLTDDFLRLSTGIAGGILQKLAQYEIKSAAVLDEKRTKGKFKEFINESNTGKSFRSYTNYNEAESWLTD